MILKSTGETEKAVGMACLPGSLFLHSVPIPCELSDSSSPSPTRPRGAMIIAGTY